MQTPYFRIGTLSSPPIQSPHGQISLRSQFVQLRFPFLSGGFIWNRPAAVVVRASNGEETSLPVVDVTRIILVTLTGLGLAALLVSMLIKRKPAQS